MRYKCANCSFVFDWEPRSTIDVKPRCPHCDSNAVDPLPISQQPQWNKLGSKDAG